MNQIEEPLRTGSSNFRRPVASRCVTLILGFLLLLAAHAAQAITTYTFNLDNMTYLHGGDYYSYGFSWNLPAGEQITDAQLTFNNLKMTTTAGNLMWADLMGSSTTLGRDEFGDFGNYADAWSASGYLIGSTTFGQVGQTYSSLTYDLANVPGALDLLDTYVGLGRFGIGIDPESNFSDNSIVFTITTAPTPTSPSVPDAGETATMLGFGILGVLVIRRKFARC
jgi:hypothetical protein